VYHGAVLVEDVHGPVGDAGQSEFGEIERETVRSDRVAGRAADEVALEIVLVGDTPGGERRVGTDAEQGRPASASSSSRFWTATISFEPRGANAPGNNASAVGPPPRCSASSNVSCSSRDTSLDVLSALKWASLIGFP